MSERKAAELVFECPEDLELRELSDVSLTISNLYSKLQLVVEEENPFEMYRKRELPLPKERLVLSKLAYGSDLTILLQAGSAIIDAVNIITALWAFKEMATEIGDSWRRKHVEDAFRKALMSSDSSIVKEAETVARNYHMTLGRLLQYVSPELEMIYESRLRVKKKTKKT